MLITCNIISEINLIVAVLNVIIVVVFSIMNYKFQKKLTKHDITIRWLNDLINIRDETAKYFKEIRNNYSKCIKKSINVRKDIKIFDTLKKDFCESAIRYLEVINKDLYIKCIGLLEKFSDNLMINISIGKNTDDIIKKINNAELDLYKIIFQFDIEY